MYLFELLQELVKYDRTMPLCTGFEGQELYIDTIITNDPNHLNKIILQLSKEPNHLTIDIFINIVSHLDDKPIYGGACHYICENKSVEIHNHKIYICF